MELILRIMTPDDLPIFKKWLSAPHVARWYHDPEDWIAEAEGMDGEFRWIHHFIAVLDGRDVGFCQYYAGRDSGEEWLAALDMEGLYSIDYLVGEPDCLRRGVGKALLRRLTEEIVITGDARRIAAAPEKENEASRALLRSSGFELTDEENGIFVKEL